MKGFLSITEAAIKSFFNDRGLSPVGDTAIAGRLKAVRPIDVADEFDVAFCRFEGEVGLDYIRRSKAGVLFVPEDMSIILAENWDGRLLIPCQSPRLEILHFISRFFVEPENSDAVLGSSHIHSTAIIAEDVTIGPFSVIGAGVVIGNGCRIGANCHIENAVIGAYTKLSSGVVIGGSGFGFEEDPLTGTTLEFPHVGGVVIGDGVTIGSNTCIDRGSIGDTVIESYVKIDNLVHIAHNVKVRSGSKIVALSMIGGSVEIGKNSWISPGVAIRDWQNVGEGALVGLGAVVVKDVEQGDVVIGNPAKSMDVTRGRRK